jgi:site-specific recombinase XerD
LLLNPGVAPIKVSRLLGHVDTTITLKVYAHFIKEKSDHVHELASSILSS